jgi:polyhydroxybutyrate depolymerase
MIRIFAVILAVMFGAASAAAETIEIGGVARAFLTQFPDRKPAPLVIVLHGNTQTGADMKTRTSWPLVAKRERFGVIFPDGLNHAWADLRPDTKRAGRVSPKGTDDVGFIVKLVEKYVADGSADPKRIYITGLSNGGAMTITLVCARADLFAAAASVIINLSDEAAAACHPSRPMPMLMMNGTVDPLIPFEGGKGASRFAVGGYWPAVKTLAFWRKLNGCETGDSAVTDLEDRDHEDQSTVTRIESRCPPARDVVLYRVNGGGHRMPSLFSDARFPRIATAFLGPQNHDIDGAETIWAFFRKFP